MNALSMRTDDYFINSAYLSELWVFENMERVVREQKIAQTDELLSQIEDEKRHARMLREAIIAEGGTPIDDVDYAMSNVIYKNVAGLDLAQLMNNVNIFIDVVELLEKRAVWIYKTYLFGGKIKRYRAICKQLLRDEQGHLKNVQPCNTVMKSVFSMDRWLFRKHLPRYYNRMDLLRCEEFWQDYFFGKLICPVAGE